MQTVMRGLGILRRYVETLGPYLLLELLLPGGTVFAVFLFLYHRGKVNIGSDALRTVPGMMRGLIGLLAQGSLMLQPRYARLANDFRHRVRGNQSRCRFGASPNGY